MPFSTTPGIGIRSGQAGEFRFYVVDVAGTEEEHFVVVGGALCRTIERVIVRNGKINIAFGKILFYCARKVNGGRALRSALPCGIDGMSTTSSLPPSTLTKSSIYFAVRE